VISRWTLTGSRQDGSPLEMTGQTSDVVRRQADGSWRLAIDNPFGDAALAE
jgi:ketosteroid isomerase-like protein